jgi:hypothetical protein
VPSPIPFSAAIWKQSGSPYFAPTFSIDVPGEPAMVQLASGSRGYEARIDRYQSLVNPDSLDKPKWFSVYGYHSTVVRVATVRIAAEVFVKFESVIVGAHEVLNVSQITL